MESFVEIDHYGFLVSVKKIKELIKNINIGISEWK